MISCPPVPTASAPLQTATLNAGESWLRIHWDSAPALGFGITRGANRFDPLPAPWASTRVLYAGETLEVAIAETILRWRQIKGPHLVDTATELSPRRVAAFAPQRDLTVIDGSGFGLASLQRAIAPGAGRADDIFDCDDSYYNLTQSWGAWLRTQCPTADGIRWMSRQFNSASCVVLFEDRCAPSLLQLGSSRPLMAAGSVEQRTVDTLLNVLGWGRT